MSLVMSVAMCISLYSSDIVKPVEHFHRNESGGVQVKNETGARCVFVALLLQQKPAK